MSATPDPPPIPGRGESPFHSEHSDITMDDYYFEEEQDDSPHNNMSSPLEYSDESEELFTSGTGRLSGGPKSSFRSRNDALRGSGQTSPMKRLSEQAVGEKIRSSGQSKKSQPQAIQTAGEEESPATPARKSAKIRSHQQNRGGSSEGDEPNWMKRWAYSFRSPVVKSKVLNPTEKTHRRQGSDRMQEYPHFGGHRQSGSFSGVLPPPPPYDPWTHLPNAPSSRGSSSANEESPLLGAGFTSGGKAVSSSLHDSSTPSSELASRGSELASRGSATNKSSPSKQAAQVAAAFLQDYEANRPPTFGGTTSVADISDYQMTLYHFKFSMLAEVGRVAATVAFFASSFMEGFLAGLESGHPYYFHRYTLTGLNLFAITIFLFDIWMRRELRGTSKQLGSARPLHTRSASATALLEKHQVRISRSEKLIQPLILFCVLLGFENVARLFLVSGDIVLFSSIFKPLVLFYVSSQARDALAAVRSILKIVLRVLVMELLLILMFAAVACRLFQEYDSFRNLGVAWLSLFELSTTVVNPSIWMPVYQDSKISALFFIFFIVTAVFYLHSLVLSVVFQTYIQAAADIHERNASDREDSVYLAFVALLKEDRTQNPSKGVETENLVDVRAVRQTLRLLRPHYSSMKINALVEIVDPSGQGTVDYATFRTKIRQALNASIRTARNASNLAMSVELVAVAVAIVNFVYVILLSSDYDSDWFDAVQVEVGCLITLVAAFELLIRFNPLRIPDFTPLTRLNTTFDGSALVAALISCIGIGMYLSGYPLALEYILIGRAIDMIRTMRFFQIFRDVIRRSSDVIPALRGPLILVVTTLHVFVYVGMALWGGAVEVGQHQGEIVELYDLNNFNSYQEGAVTMFQIIAVNDWYAIADVFLYATRNSSVYIVYLFFIIANLICVSIMLNVLTAFFVESFVTKLHDDKDAPAEATATMHKERDFSIETSEADVRRVSSSNSLKPKDELVVKSGDSDASSESERIEFDVYERQGFDKIMQTVSGSAYQGDFARDICNYLEIYESLAPGRETVGYLVCDQQTLERFGNRRFKTKAIGCLDENKLHSVVTDMHSELLALAPRTNFQDRSLIRTFPHKREPGKALEISASLLRRHPALSLFVSRTIVTEQNSGTPPLPGNPRR